MWVWAMTIYSRLWMNVEKLYLRAQLGFWRELIWNIELPSSHSSDRLVLLNRKFKSLVTMVIKWNGWVLDKRLLALNCSAVNLYWSLTHLLCNVTSDKSICQRQHKKKNLWILWMNKSSNQFKLKSGDSLTPKYQLSIRVHFWHILSPSLKWNAFPIVLYNLI